MSTKFIRQSRKLIHRWKGIAIIMACTLIFFSPYLVRIDSYSEGGDAMFNAWLLSRTHRCLLRQDCPKYLDGNIFYPHRDTMLFSETQLSAGLLTLPLHFINPHPIFAFNVWVITQFFLSGLFMYFLAKHLNRNHEYASIVAGLIFAFAPMRIAVVAHMQNASVFYMPLISLLILKFLETKNPRYLPLVFITLFLYFYASWYQMVFGLIALCIMLMSFLIFKYAKPRYIAAITGTIMLAVLATLPLAKEYIRFSATNNAKFSIIDQIEYASSLVDYIIPQLGTLFGELVRHPSAHINAINPDSISYHGFVLYAIALFLGISVYRKRSVSKSLDWEAKLVLTFLILALVGLIVSLGPYLKVFDSTHYQLPNGYSFDIPMPYLLFDKLLPQLSFIRAIGRASILVLFSLCCLLALLPRQLRKIGLGKNKQLLVLSLTIVLLIFELMPLHYVRMSKEAYAYNLSIPAVYEYIQAHREIDNYIVLHADQDYPNTPWKVAEPEQAMWAGYINRSVFNGYSGYFPPAYESDLRYFKSLAPDVVPKMEQYGLKYILIDKQLSQSDPNFAEKARNIFSQMEYQDDRYELFKL